MTAPLELAWELPGTWFFVPLDGGADALDEAVTATLDERAERDPDAMAAYPELRDMLRDHARRRADTGAVVALVRWGLEPGGALVSAFASVDRYEHDGGDTDTEAEVEARRAELGVERPDERGAPVVERITAPLGPGLRREAVREVHGAPAEGLFRSRRRRSAEVAPLALVLEIWVWVEGNGDVLRVELVSFQVGQADVIGEELDAIVGSLARAPG